ncbi:hypothetical protein [Helicobacter pylori]|uniref:hypothetical protein n=1 Tax=Helicobacter pylori TaxID=210 RepID=UPI00041936A7|nr:hypothetical protein [Helicobacter pylori]
MAVRFDDNSMVVGSEEMENADNGNECFMPVISSEKDSKMFFSKLKNSLLDSGLDKSYLKDSRYPKNFSYAFYLFFTTNDDNELSIHIGCECVNVDFIREYFISDDTKHYNRIVFEFEYALKEEDKQCLIELVPIKYNNNLSYSTKEENQFKKESLNTTNS